MSSSSTSTRHDWTAQTDVSSYPPVGYVACVALVSSRSRVSLLVGSLLRGRLFSSSVGASGIVKLCHSAAAWVKLVTSYDLRSGSWVTGICCLIQNFWIVVWISWRVISKQYAVYSRPVESHNGARGNLLAGTTNIFTGPLWGENFLDFSFQSGTFWCTLYFWLTARPPNVAGPGVANPLPYPINGPECDSKKNFLIGVWLVKIWTKVKCHLFIGLPCRLPVV